MNTQSLIEAPGGRGLPNPNPSDVSYGNEDEAVDLIYQALTSQAFADWYADEFEAHITGDDVIDKQYPNHEASKAACKEEIKSLFNTRVLR